MIRLLRRLVTGDLFVLRFKDEPSPPPAPAPVASPQEQISAQARAIPSYYGPSGTRVVSGDPNVTGSFRIDETMSPEQQAIYSGRNSVAQALLGRASAGLGSTPATFTDNASRLPGTFTFSGADDPTTAAFFQNQKKLLDKTFAQDETRLDDKLVNQGLPMGSEAYDKEMANFRQSKDDAYARAAADALQAGFGQELSTRQQRQNESQLDYQRGLSTRQQALNEVAQALGGSQLTPIGQTGALVDPAAAFASAEAARNRQYQGDLANYNAGVASNNATMGGLFQLGSAAVPYLFSDRRLKRDVVRVGEFMPGVGLYEYRYLWDDELQRGVMADELEKVRPDAVSYDANGFAMVDYGRLEGLVH